MKEKLQGLLHRYWDGKTFKSESEMLLYTFLIVAIFFSLSVHICLLTFYIVVKIPFMAIVNVGSLAVSVLNLLLHRHKKYRAVGSIITIESMLYTIIASCFTGIYSYVALYVFMVLIMQVYAPYASVKFRVRLFTFWWAVAMVAIGFSLFIEPPYILEGAANVVMILFNFSSTCVAIAAQLSINTFIVASIHELNQKKIASLQIQANKDALTGLYNRRYSEAFFKEIKEQEPAQEWCIAGIDIDKFKLVNDRYGHAFGDVVLKNLSEYLINSLRSTDVVFRWGGEEFLVFLKNVKISTAYDILEKLRVGVSQQKIVTEDNEEVSYTITVGVAKLDLNDIEEAIELCDKRMYAGKNAGRNRVVSA